MPTFLYRINGGQVQGASLDPTAYDNRDTQFFDIAIAVATPDGQNLVPPKIFDGTVVRNATSAEQTAFAAAEATDDNLLHRRRAKELLDTQLQMRKILRALVKVLVDEINTLRAQHALPARTNAQAFTAIQNEIDAGTFD